MPEKKQNLAIILARGGSKGIPKKNIMGLAGRPLIAWSIEQAKNSQLVDIVFVSTDDNEIAGISQECGAQTIRRPAELATDSSSSEEALLHAIDFIEGERKIEIGIIVFLQATSPLRQKDDIDNAIRQYGASRADSLFSCAKLRDHFIWKKENGGYCSINYDYRNRKPRQVIEPQYLENGSIYIFRPEIFKKLHNRLGGKIAVYEMPLWQSFQIDSPDDIGICEYYIKKIYGQRKR